MFWSLWLVNWGQLPKRTFLLLKCPIQGNSNRFNRYTGIRLTYRSYRCYAATTEEALHPQEWMFSQLLHLDMCHGLACIITHRCPSIQAPEEWNICFAPSPRGGNVYERASLIWQNKAGWGIYCSDRWRRHLSGLLITTFAAVSIAVNIRQILNRSH